MSKNTMITLNTQLILLATWCLLEVDARNSRKSHESLNNVFEKKWESNVLEIHEKTKWKEQRAWKMKTLKGEMKHERPKMEVELDYFEKSKQWWL
jgi:hypothetical protein